MTERTYGTDTTPDPAGSTTDVAKDQARSVAKDAVQGGQQVAATAQEEGRQVAGEAKTQAREMYHQVRGEAAEQAAVQQQRAASGLRALSDELGSMADHSGGSGLAGDLARQASGQIRAAASWLECREPGDVISEVSAFGRTRPGAFLATAAVLGFLGGRLTRGLVDEERGDGDPETSGSASVSQVSRTGTAEPNSWSAPAGSPAAFPTGEPSVDAAAGGADGSGFQGQP